MNSMNPDSGLFLRVLRRLFMVITAAGLIGACGGSKSGARAPGLSKSHPTYTLSEFNSAKVAGSLPHTFDIRGYLFEAHPCYCPKNAACEECAPWSITLTQEKPEESDYEPARPWRRGPIESFYNTEDEAPYSFLEGLLYGEPPPESDRPRLVIGREYLIKVETFTYEYGDRTVPGLRYLGHALANPTQREEIPTVGFDRFGSSGLQMLPDVFRLRFFLSSICPCQNRSSRICEDRATLDRKQSCWPTFTLSAYGPADLRVVFGENGSDIRFHGFPGGNSEQFVEGFYDGTKPAEQFDPPLIVGTEYVIEVENIEAPSVEGFPQRSMRYRDHWVAGARGSE